MERLKIDVMEPECNECGTIYFAGFVNDEYVHFLGYERLTLREIKNKLVQIYNEEVLNIFGRD